MLCIRFVAGMFLFSSCTVSPASSNNIAKPLGIGGNLNAPTFKSSSTCLANLARTALPWHNRADHALWTDVDARGYPLSVPPDGLYSLAINQYDPDGRYVLTWEGSGVMRMDGIDGHEMRLIEDEPGRQVYQVDTASYFSLVIVSQDPDDRIRNVCLWLPGCEGRISPWNPAWLSCISQFEPLRLSGLMEGLPGTTNDYTFMKTGRGVPLSWLADLATATGRDLWVTIPKQADDEQVRAMAQTFKTAMPSGIVCYVEYGNGGPALPQKLSAAQRLTARVDHIKRSVAVLSVWRDVFGAESNRVAGVYAEPLETAESATELKEAFIESGAARNIDVLAISPHAGIGIRAAFKRPVKELTADDLFAALFASEVNEVRPQLARAKALAVFLNLQLAAFSAGQHISYYRGKVSMDEHDDFARLIAITARDPRMETFYRQHFKDWRAVSDGPYIHDELVSNVHHVAHWGLKETLEQPDAEAPKMRALPSSFP